jgi:hypothetical protein
MERIAAGFRPLAHCSSYEALELDKIMIIMISHGKAESARNLDKDSDP